MACVIQKPSEKPLKINTSPGFTSIEHDTQSKLIINLDFVYICDYRKKTKPIFEVA